MQLSIAGEFGKLESSSGTTWLSLARLPLPSPSSDSLPSRLWRQCSLKRMVSEGIGSSRRKEENEVARMRFGAGTSCEITLSSMVVLRLYQLRVTPSRIVSKRVQSSKRLVSGGERAKHLSFQTLRSPPVRFDRPSSVPIIKVERHDASSLCFVLSHGATLSESLRLAADFTSDRCEPAHPRETQAFAEDPFSLFRTLRRGGDSTSPAAQSLSLQPSSTQTSHTRSFCSRQYTRLEATRKASQIRQKEQRTGSPSLALASRQSSRLISNAARVGHSDEEVLDEG